MDHAHSHKNEQGILVKCYHQCRHWLSPAFLAGWLVASTITFPLEHFQWEKVWPFYLYTHWMEHQPTVAFWVSMLVLIFWIAAIIVGVVYAAKRNLS